MSIDYKISQMHMTKEGVVTALVVRYYLWEPHPKTGVLRRTTVLSQERLTPMRVLSDSELHDSLNARCRAKYPKEDIVAVQQSVDHALLIDKTYPVMHEGLDPVNSPPLLHEDPIDIVIPPIDVPPVKEADATPKGG
jgi:hypothetical protein